MVLGLAHSTSRAECTGVRATAHLARVSAVDREAGEREHPARMRRAVSCAVAVALAAVADNAVVCGGDAPGDAPGACAEMPCHTPTLVPDTAVPTPILAPQYAVAVSLNEPASADAPPPPTPPPTARA
jgi:hypothetical protein